MNQHDALKYCKENISKYLALKGIDPNHAFHCLNPEHEDRRPSMRLDTKRCKVHCFSCGADFDIINLVQIETGLSGSALFNKTYEIFGLHLDDSNQYKKTSLPLKPKLDSTCSKESKSIARQKVIPQDKVSLKSNSSKKIEAERANISNNEYTDKSICIDVCHNNNTENKDINDYSEYFLACKKNINGTDYAVRRGLSSATLELFNLGFDPEWKHPKALSPHIKPTPRLIIPTSSNSYIARDIRADLSDEAKKYSKMKVGAVNHFNLIALGEADKAIFIVEAEFDALSVIEVGGIAIGLGSTSGINSFIECLKLNKPRHPLILSLDNDSAGERASRKLEQALNDLEIPFYKSNISGDYKDPSDALEHEREAFKERILLSEEMEHEERLAEKEAYLKTSAKHRLSAFADGIDASINTSVIPTGFSKLDKLLDGGFYEGLYVIGAISSLGKTTFALQIIDQIAQDGQDALVFSLEMSKDELIAKSISRLTMEDVLRNGGNTSFAKTVRGITEGRRYKNYNDAEQGLIHSALSTYYDYAEHIFISEGMGEVGVKQIRQAVQRHLLFTGKRPVVLVDYLQILAAHNPRATDKQNIDRAVLELKRISRDFKVPVIAISSFNRAGYGDSVKMEGFKESGAIEYSADVLIGLQLAGAGSKDFNVDEAKSKNPREVELVILKSRNGPTGGKAGFKFYAAYNYFVGI